MTLAYLTMNGTLSKSRALVVGLLSVATVLYIKFSDSFLNLVSSSLWLLRSCA